MLGLAQSPARNRGAEKASLEVERRFRPEQHYYAFLSYSHNDEAVAEWLHGELEGFHVPPALAGKLAGNGVIPKRLAPIFRDRHELAAATDLGAEIKQALASSQYLIVLCSPAAARSRWTNAEIELFKRTRPDGCVLAAIVAGEPFASESPGRQKEECFPPALREKYDRRGRPTGKRAEPLAADLREAGDGRRMGFLKLVAGMLGVGLDDLVQRETTQRHRRLGWLAAASLAGMAVTSTLAVTAIQGRDAARDQRRQAEGLVAFMLGDLRDKLEPIGKLDALDGVGSKVLAYYSNQDASSLSDAGLVQRSRALSLMAEVATARGSIDEALRLYGEAMKGTAEAIRRNPDDPQGLFDHAQNVFYVGQIAAQRGDFRTWEQRAREYKRLAMRMVALGPDNMKWRMERQYADTNLGVALYNERRFPEAVTQLSAALKGIEAISAADPENAEYRKSIGESLAWLADAQSALGRYDDALRARLRNIEVLNGLLASSDNVDYRQRLIPARRALGNLYFERGQSDLAIEQFRAAIAHADALTALEPSNTLWLGYGYKARADLAALLLNTDQKEGAASQTRFVCQAVGKLLIRDPHNPELRKGLTNCWLLQARLALRTGAKEQALGLAERALSAARSVHTDDLVGDAFLVARAYRLIGDIQRELSNADGARTTWATALAKLPDGVAEMPAEMAEHAMLLQRLGRAPEARERVARLGAIGYSDPEFRNA